MSSSLSLAGQRFRENVGLATKSADADLVTTSAKLDELLHDVKLLRAVLDTACKSATTQLASARKQASTILIGLAGKTTAGPDAEFFGKFTSVHDYLDGTLPEKLYEAFVKAVLGPLDEWLTDLAGAKGDVKETDAKRVVFDHYREKMASLKEDRKKQQMAGKIVSQKDNEKILRNEQKFAAASEEWYTWRDRCVGRLLHVFEGASGQLMNVLCRLMQFEQQLYKDGFTAVKAFEPVAAVLLTRVRDRRAADAAVSSMERCIRFARERREAGKPLAFEGYLTVGAEGGSPTAAAPVVAERSPFDTGIEPPSMTTSHAPALSSGAAYGAPSSSAPAKDVFGTSSKAQHEPASASAAGAGAGGVTSKFKGLFGGKAASSSSSSSSSSGGGGEGGSDSLSQGGRIMSEDGGYSAEDFAPPASSTPSSAGAPQRAPAPSAPPAAVRPGDSWASFGSSSGGGGGVPASGGAFDPFSSGGISTTTGPAAARDPFAVGPIASSPVAAAAVPVALRAPAPTGTRSRTGSGVTPATAAAAQPTSSFGNALGGSLSAPAAGAAPPRPRTAGSVPSGSAPTSPGNPFGGPAASSGWGDDPFGSAPAAAAAAPAVALPVAPQRALSSGNPFGGDIFGTPAPATTAAAAPRPAASGAFGGGGGWDSFDAPSPAPAPAAPKAGSAHANPGSSDYDPFSGM